MNKITRIGASLIAISGLVQEGLNVKHSEEFTWQSVLIVVLCAIALFTLNVKKFLKMDLEKFDFDQHNNSFFQARDRSRVFAASIKVVSPP